MSNGVMWMPFMKRSQHPVDWWPSMHARNTGIFQILWGAAVTITAVMGIVFQAASCVTYGYQLTQAWTGIVIFTGPLFIITGVFGVSSANGSSFLVGSYLAMTGVSISVGCGLGGMAVVNGLEQDATYNWLIQEGTWTVSAIDGATMAQVEGRLAIDIVLAVLIGAELITGIVALTLTCCMPGCCQPDPRVGAGYPPGAVPMSMQPQQAAPGVPAGQRVPGVPGAPVQSYPPAYQGFTSPKPYA